MSEQSVINKKELVKIVLKMINNVDIPTQAKLTNTVHQQYGIGTKRIRDAIKHLEDSGLIKHGPYLLDMRTFAFKVIPQPEVVQA